MESKNQKERELPFVLYVVDCLVFAAAGLMLSGVLEKVFRVLDVKWENDDLLMLLLQVIIAATCLYILEHTFSREFASAWQRTTTGLFFVAFFFRLQTTMVKNALYVQHNILHYDPLSTNHNE